MSAPLPRSRAAGSRLRVNGANAPESAVQRRRLRRLAALLLFLAAGAMAAPRAAIAQEIEARYQLAVTQFEQVQRDVSAPLDQRAARWRAVAQAFERIHRDAPTQRRGADASFSAALSLREAWLLSRSREDASDTLAAFRNYAAEYPDSPLAEDSRMHEAALLETQPGGSQAAYELYRQVASRTPASPHAALARARLNALLREQRTRVDPLAAQRPADGDAPSLVPYGAPSPASPSAAAAASGSAVSTAARPEPAQARRAGPLRIKRVQALSALQFTRIIVTTSRPVKPAVQYAARPQGQLRLDFKRVQAAPGLALPIAAADGLLKRAALAPLDGKGTRLVFDVGALERYEIKTFELPVEFKLVVDLYPRRPPAVAASAGKNPGGRRVKTPSGESGARAAGRTRAAARPSEAPPAVASLPGDSGLLSLKTSLGLKVRTVMLDPGHGGHDPGAIGFGLQEKDLALAIALRLRTLIQQRHPDVRVGMTREDDRFIPLARRPILAKAFGADLFVSIHLNASPAERLAGVETYFLNLTSDASALAVAARENATTEKKVSDLNVILLDLLRDTNILESSKLAQAMHTELVDSLKDGYPVRDLGVKQAPFMVLIGAEMPSVLVEAGFVTNRGESARLKTDAYLDRIAEGIYAGLDKYMADEEIADAGAPFRAPARGTGDTGRSRARGTRDAARLLTRVAN